MLTPYDRKQQAAERAALAAKHIAATPATLGVPSCDWDAELAKLGAKP